MGKCKEIVDGYKNLLFVNEEIEKMAEERLAFCDECEHVKYLNRKLGIYCHCDLCWCKITALIRSPQKHCVLGRF
jgi:hypothetical protein